MVRRYDARPSLFDPAGFPARRRSSPVTGWIAAVLILAAAGGLIHLHGRISSRPFWTVNAVWVEGNRSISTADLMERLGLRPGMPWWKVATTPGRELAAVEPRLADLCVRWRWPRDLSVRVRERESVLRVLGDVPLELAGDGILLEPEELIDPVDLPILTGALPPGLCPGQRFELPAAGQGWREILDTGSALPSLWKRISQIHYVGGRSFQLFLREGRQVILWEAGMNCDAKRSIPAVLADLSSQGIEEAVLDLRFRDQIVVR